MTATAQSAIDSIKIAEDRYDTAEPSEKNARALDRARDALYRAREKARYRY